MVVPTTEPVLDKEDAKTGRPHTGMIVAVNSTLSGLDFNITDEPAQVEHSITGGEKRRDSL